MRFPVIPVIATIAATLLFLLPGAVAAQEDPEVVYGKFHRALLAGNIDELNRYGTPGGAAEIAKMPPEQRKGVLEMMKKLIPSSYSITGRQPGADPNRLTLRATGMGMSLFSGNLEAQDGVILMQRIGGEWKVAESNWSNAKPGAVAARPAVAPPAAPPASAKSAPPSQPAPLPRSTPKAPAPVAGAAREACVYKPVMTDEDMKRCR